VVVRLVRWGGSAHRTAFSLAEIKAGGRLSWEAFSETPLRQSDRYPETRSPHPPAAHFVKCEKINHMARNSPSDQSAGFTVAAKPPKDSILTVNSPPATERWVRCEKLRASWPSAIREILKPCVPARHPALSDPPVVYPDHLHLPCNRLWVLVARAYP